MGSLRRIRRFRPVYSIAWATTGLVAEELGHPVQRFTEDASFQILPGERQKFEAVARILRSASLKKERAQLERLIAPIEEQDNRSDANALALFGLHEEIHRRIRRGESDEDIVAGIPTWEPDLIRALAAVQRGVDPSSGRVKAAK